MVCPCSLMEVVSSGRLAMFITKDMEKEKGKGMFGLDAAVGQDGAKRVGETARPPLPSHLLALRKRSYLVFVANLALNISKPELEAMF